jgi:hypothetical protein
MFMPGLRFTRLPSKIGQRQLHHMAEQPGAEFYIDAAGGVAEDVGAQGIEDALEDDDDHQTDDQHVERGHAFVHQHFVHNNLEE